MGIAARPSGRSHYQTLLELLDESVQALGGQVAEAIGESVHVFDRRDVAAATRLIDADSSVDALRHEIDEQAFVLIATQQPAASDLRLVFAASGIASELERIGDYCSGIGKLTLTVAGEPVGGPTRDIQRMADITADLLRGAIEAFKGRDIDRAGRIWIGDDAVDRLYRDIFQRQIDEMVTDRSTVRRGTYILWAAHNVERMADRVTNIAESVAFVVNGDVPAFRAKVEARTVPR